MTAFAPIASIPIAALPGGVQHVQVLSASQDFTGVLVRGVARSVAGVSDASGAVSSLTLLARTFAASLDPSGTVGRHALRAFDATVVLAGAVVRSGTRTISGAVALAGVIGSQTTVAAIGALSMGRAVTRSMARALARALALDGVLATARAMFAGVGGAVSFARSVAGTRARLALRFVRRQLYDPRNPRP